MNGLNAMLVRIGCGAIPDTYPPPPPKPVLHWKQRMVAVKDFRDNPIDEFRYWRKQFYVKPVIQKPSDPKSRLIRASAGMLAYTEESPELLEQNRAERNNK